MRTQDTPWTVTTDGTQTDALRWRQNRSGRRIEQSAQLLLRKVPFDNFPNNATFKFEIVEGVTLDRELTYRGLDEFLRKRGAIEMSVSQFLWFVMHYTNEELGYEQIVLCHRHVNLRRLNDRSRNRPYRLMAYSDNGGRQALRIARTIPGDVISHGNAYAYCVA